MREPKSIFGRIGKAWHKSIEVGEKCFLQNSVFGPREGGESLLQSSALAEQEKLKGLAVFVPSLSFSNS